MNRPSVTVVCGNDACKPPILTLLSEEERIATFFRSAECVNRPPAVPTNGDKSVAGSERGQRS